MVFSVGNVELHVAVLAEVPLQPVGFRVDLIQNPEHQLLRGHREVENADPLLVGHSRVGPRLDQSVTEGSATTKVGQKEGWNYTEMSEWTRRSGTPYAQQRLMYTCKLIPRLMYTCYTKADVFIPNLMCSYPMYT